MLSEERERRRRGERYVEAGGDGALRRVVGVVFLLGRRRRRRAVDPFDREDLPVAAVLSDRTRSPRRSWRTTSSHTARSWCRRGARPFLMWQRSARWTGTIFATSSRARKPKRRSTPSTAGPCPACSTRLAPPRSRTRSSSAGPSASTSHGAGARPSTAAARGCERAIARRGLERRSTWEGNELNTIMN